MYRLLVHAVGPYLLHVDDQTPQPVSVGSYAATISCEIPTDRRVLAGQEQAG